MKLKLSREFKIGFFGILMIAALYWGVNFLKGTDLFTSSVHYYAAYDQVNGLQPSAAVVIKGYKVGTISDISYDPQRSNNVVVEFAIKSKFKIPKDTKARIFSDGIMGGKSIELELGRSDAYLHEGDTLFSEINKDFLEVAGSEFEFLKQRANDVISEMIVTLRGINKLLSDNSANLNATIGNVAAITGDLRSVVADEKGSLRETISNVNDLSRTLRDKTGQIDRIFTNVERFSDSLSQSRIPTLVAQMNGTLAGTEPYARESQRRGRDGRQVRQRPSAVRLARSGLVEPVGTASRPEAAPGPLRPFLGVRTARPELTARSQKGPFIHLWFIKT